MNPAPDTGNRMPNAEIRLSRLFSVSWLVGLAVLALGWWLHSPATGLLLGVGAFLLICRWALGRTRRKVAAVVQQLCAEGRVQEARRLIDASVRKFPKDPVLISLDDQLTHLESVQATVVDMSQPVAEQPREELFDQPDQPEAVGFRTEPPVASALAACVWVVAVFSFFPVLGVLPALVMGVCSVILLVRNSPYPWDRRIGIAGLVLSLAAGAVPGLWVTMLLVSPPAPLPEIQVGEIPTERSWTMVAVQFAVLIGSVVLHECAHGLSAYWSGDATAARQGRLRLNPLVHVDIFGSIILPLVMALVPGGVIFGWAKPVPIEPRQFRKRRRGLLAVTLAGVSVNMLLALACASGLVAVGSALRLAYPDVVSDGFMIPFQEVKLQGVANAAAWQLAIEVLKHGMIVNLVLFAFNVLPIPPLDGYGVLESLTPPGLSRRLTALRPFGMFVLLGLIIFGVIGYLLLPAVLAALLLNFIAGAMTGMA